MTIQYYLHQCAVFSLPFSYTSQYYILQPAIRTGIEKQFLLFRKLTNVINLKRKATIRSDVCKWTPCLRMALKILPILYLNLGGEMMYIIDQRLIAQKVPSDKSSKGNTCHCGKFWFDK